MQRIARPGGTRPNIYPANQSTWKHTIFSYDAGGQLMAEYDIEYAAANKFTLNNNGHYLYGASKLGRTKRKTEIKTLSASSYTNVTACASCATAELVAPLAVSRFLGFKQYEFSNHLGNVLVTLSDRRLTVDDGVTYQIITYYIFIKKVAVYQRLFYFTIN